MGLRRCGYGAGPLVVGVLGGGIGRGCNLASEALRRLVAGALTLALTTSQSNLCSRCLTIAFWVSAPTSCVNEERSGFDRDRDWVEEEGPGWVESAGGSIGRVLHTRDVSGVYRSSAILRKLDDASENVVRWLVGAALFPPTFDDPAVVSVNHDMISFARQLA